MHDKADRYEVGSIVIKERPTACTVVQRPTKRVLHEPGAVPFRRHLPQLLEAQAELLRLAAFAQAELGSQGFAQRPACAFGDDGVFALELHAATEAAGWLAVSAEPHVAGGNAGYGSVFVVEDLGRGKPRVDLHAQLRGLLAEPAADIAETDDVVAVIAHERRHDEVGYAQPARRPEVVKAVLGHGRLDRRTLRPPIRNERVEADWIDHGPRQDVGANLRTLLQHHDRKLTTIGSGELPQPDCGGKAGGARTDDHDIEFHRLPGRELEYQRAP